MSGRLQLIDERDGEVLERYNRIVVDRLTDEGGISFVRFHGTHPGWLPGLQAARDDTRALAESKWG